MRSESVLDALAQWFADHQARGGDFDPEALGRAGEAALRAERAGMSFEEAFEAGRSTYFQHLGPNRSRESDVA